MQQRRERIWSIQNVADFEINSNHVGEQRHIHMAYPVWFTAAGTHKVKLELVSRYENSVQKRTANRNPTG